MMTTTQNEGFTGAKFDRSLSVKEIAARIREDFKAALKAGDLPAGLKLSVTTDYSSTSAAIRVRIKALPAGLQRHTAEYLAHQAAHPHDFFRGERRTPEIKALLAKLSEMVNAYNFDKSDIMTDYFHKRFYDSITFDDGEIG